MKIDLGFKPDHYYGEMISSPAELTKEAPKEPPTIYPVLTIADKPDMVQAVELGDEMEVTVRLRVSRIEQRKGKREYESKEEDCRVEFDVLSIDLPRARSESSREERPDFSKLGKKSEE